MKHLSIFALFSALILSPVIAHAFEPNPTTDYKTVAASQTDAVLGPVGGAGDILERLIIVPATTGAGTVSIKDGSGSSINVFVTGTLSNLTPIVVPIGARSMTGAWKVTTGANVSVIGVGRFR